MPYELVNIHHILPLLLSGGEVYYPPRRVCITEPFLKILCAEVCVTSHLLKLELLHHCLHPPL